MPREGGVLWVDNLAIPAQAPHRDTAEKFINYILDAKVGAQLSNFNQYATPNKAAKAFITPGGPRQPGDLSLGRDDGEARVRQRPGRRQQALRRGLDAGEVEVGVERKLEPWRRI